ncbi:MAG: hypothetical protein FWG87_15060 [Defluviitaleaceae bacterium]|nr:hypothetical protein [Defluviitaleaceae bacterium]
MLKFSWTDVVKRAVRQMHEAKMCKLNTDLTDFKGMEHGFSRITRIRSD